MSVECSENAGTSQLSVDGELTIYNVAEYKEKVLASLSQSKALELDLSKVAEIDGAGIQLLIILKQEAANGGKQILFANHSESVLEVIELLNLATGFGDPIVIPTQWQQS